MKNQQQQNYLSETDKILNKQSEVLKKIDKQHQLLLTANNENDIYEDIKSALKWDDTDRIIKEEYNKILELKDITSKNIDAKILNYDSILEYCYDNGYVLVNISDYKGKICEELLEAIKQYSINNSIRLDSNYNVEQLYLLCPNNNTEMFSNNDIKRSKRYTDKELSKLILLEKQVKGNAYKEDHYKIIFEIGKLQFIKNIINKYRYTIPEAYNLYNNFRWILGISIGIFTLISMGCIFGDITNNSLNGLFSNTISYVFTFISILILAKGIFPQVFSDEKGDLSFNIHNSTKTIVSRIYNYKSNDYENKYSIIYMFKRYNKINYKPIFKIKLIISILLASLYLMTTLSAVHISRLILLYKRNGHELIHFVNNEGTVYKHNYYKLNSNGLTYNTKSESYNFNAKIDNHKLYVKQQQKRLELENKFKDQLTNEK